MGSIPSAPILEYARSWLLLIDF
jgi:hypothetical protein